MKSSSKRPNVLLITVDTLRPDALGWVAGKNRTPTLDALAANGMAFPEAISPVPLTLPSHTSILTGLLPRHHGVRDNGQVFGSQVPTLPEALRHQGYATAAFVGGHPLRALFGLDRGFDRYDDALPSDQQGWLERPAAQTVQAALGWLRDRQSSPPRNWFVWVHFYEPHTPYDPPADLVQPGPRGAYDAEAADVDRSIDVLLQGIQSLQPDAPLLIVLTSDHGESLGEHGEPEHGFFVYQATARVPLIVSWPGVVAPGRSAQPVRLIDIAPTLLDLLAAPAFPGIDGVSLRDLLEGRASSVPAAVVETQQPWLAYGWAPLTAVLDDGWKLIRAPRPELYDLRTDPAETVNRFEAEPQRAQQLSQRLQELEARPERTAESVQDPEALAGLEALGYVSGPARQAPQQGLANPRDQLPVKDRLAAAEEDLRRGDQIKALQEFEAVLQAQPDNRYALLRSGIVLAASGQLGAAIPRLQQLLKLDPRQAEASYALADAWTQQGNLPQAITQWQATVELQPRRAVAWSNLGILLFRVGKPQQALTALERAVALQPDDPVLRENLEACRQHLRRNALPASPP